VARGFGFAPTLLRLLKAQRLDKKSDGRTLVLPRRSLQNPTGICPGFYILWEPGGGKDAKRRSAPSGRFGHGWQLMG